MAQNRTGLADVLLGGLIIGATALVVALPGLCAPAYMGSGQGAAQVRHQVTALPATALESVADAGDGETTNATTSRSLFTLRATHVVRHGPDLANWQGPDGVSVARFLERAGRLACPSTAPPRPLG